MSGTCGLIRKRLAAMGLDWDAPAYSDVTPGAPALPPFRVDLGLRERAEK